MPSSSRIAIKVGGAALQADVLAEVVDARVEQSVLLPDRLTVRLFDPEFELLDGTMFEIGKVLEIGFADEEHQRIDWIGNGEITAIEVEQAGDGRHVLVVSGLDKAHRLARSVRVQTYLDKKDSDIVKEIAGHHNLTPAVDVTQTQHEHLLQSETDYAFISRLAQSNGFDWWVSGKDLHFKKSARNGSGPEFTWGDDIKKFRVRFTSTETASSVEVIGWDAKAKKSIDGKTSRQKVDSTDARIGERNASQSEEVFGRGKARRFQGMTPVIDKEQADTIAGAIARTATASQVLAKGEVDGDPRLKAGTEVTINGVGKKLSGKYLLTSVEHVYGEGRPYVTRFESGGNLPGGLVDLLGSPGTRRPPLWDGSRPAIGIVTNVEDPEGLGRVKVKFPTAGKDDKGQEIESDWSRVMGLGAGPERGLMILPEINDEVLVLFEHGDVARPIVVGGLWNSKDKPPLAKADSIADKKIVGRTLTTRSGNRIEIIDGASADKDEIIIETRDGKASLTLAGDRVELQSAGDITITGQKKLAVKMTGDATIEAMNLTLKAMQKLTLEGGTDLAAKGGISAKLEGTTIDIKANAKLALEGGGMAEVKGGIVKLN